MNILALVFAIQIELDLRPLIQALRGRDDAPRVECAIRTVAYRFVGKPGQTFEYAGDVYVVPEEGWIELIAAGVTSYRFGGRKLPLDVWPADSFSIREVPLPE